MRVLVFNPFRRRGWKRTMLGVICCALALAVFHLGYDQLGQTVTSSVFQIQLVFNQHDPTLPPSFLELVRGLTTALPHVAASSQVFPVVSNGSAAAHLVSESPQSRCKSNEYFVNDLCRECHSQCVGCYGHGDETCLECRHAKDGSRCVNVCPKSRPFRGGNSGKWCTRRCASDQVADSEKRCVKNVATEVATHNFSKLGWHFDPSVNLDFPDSAFTTYQPSAAVQESRFLLPILPYGPNNQYRGFKESIIAAMYMKRTLVLPPFFNHYSVSLPGHMAANKRRLAERFVMAPQETFDIDTLSEAMPVASWKQFEEACQGQVAIEYHCRNDHEMVVERSYYFYHVTKLNADHAEKVYLGDIMKNWTITPAQKVLATAFATPHRCAVLAFPYHTLILTGSHHAYLSKCLQRPILTRQMASVAWQGLLQGQKYIAVHWRFNSEWGRQWCKQTVAFHYNESQVPHNMLPECNVLKASNLHVLEVLQALMKKHHIQHVYLAFIGPSKGLDRYLSNHIKHLVMASHVKAKLEIPNNYALSLVEQELCSGAEVFIGSTKSSWSQNVIDERYGGGKQSSHHNLWWHLIV